MSEGGASIAKGEGRALPGMGEGREEKCRDGQRGSAERGPYRVRGPERQRSERRHEEGERRRVGVVSRIVRSGSVACSIARSALASVTDEAAPVATRRAAEYRARKSYPAGSVDRATNAISQAAAASAAAAATGARRRPRS